MHIDLQTDDLVKVNTQNATYSGMTGTVTRFSGTLFEGKPEASCNVLIKLDKPLEWPYLGPDKIQVLAYQLNLIYRTGKKSPRKHTRLEDLILS